MGAAASFIDHDAVGKIIVTADSVGNYIFLTVPVIALSICYYWAKGDGMFFAFKNYLDEVADIMNIFSFGFQIVVAYYIWVVANAHTTAFKKNKSPPGLDELLGKSPEKFILKVLFASVAIVVPLALLSAHLLSKWTNNALGYKDCLDEVADMVSIISAGGKYIFSLNVPFILLIHFELFNSLELDFFSISRKYFTYHS